jgi:hypothetical protein
MNDSSRKSCRSYLVVAQIIGILSLLLIIGVACGPLVTPTPPLVLPPAFPWPPPNPSAQASLSMGSLQGLTFGDVDARISQALASAGYDEKSYYAVPNGFVTVTRLEQMDSAGYPSSYDRWVSSLKPISLTGFSLSRYLEALFSVPKGHYRIFVFLVTSNMVFPSGNPVNQSEAENWVVKGASKLPSYIEVMPYTNEHTTTIYIYEFIQSGVGGAANQNIPSDFTGRQHLEHAGLWEKLNADCLRISADGNSATVEICPSSTLTPTNTLKPTNTPTPTNTPEPSVQITNPIDNGTLSCDNSPDQSFCLFHVQGKISGVGSFSDYRVYVFVFPLTPSGAGWYLQKSPAAIQSNGDWELSPAYLGNATFRAEKGNTLKVRAVLVKGDATFNGTKLEDLAQSKDLIVFPAIEDIDGDIAISDIVDLTLNR